LTVTSGNYEFIIQQDDPNQGALQIDPAQLFYTANPFSRVYGQLNPTVTGTVTGLRNGEALDTVALGSIFWETETDETTDVGLYRVEGQGLVVFNNNYESNIEQSASNEFAVTITPAQLFYLADPRSRIYGFPDAPFTGQVTGFALGDTIEDVTGGTLGFTTPAPINAVGGQYAINGGGLTITSINYIPTILQDPSNATALTIQNIPSQATQANGETMNEEDTAEQEQNDMSTRSNDLGIVGVGIVSDDLSDGKNDQLADQLCVLGAAEAANAAGCIAQQQGQGR
jgi:hypothetical protein